MAPKLKILASHNADLIADDSTPRFDKKHAGARLRTDVKVAPSKQARKGWFKLATGKMHAMIALVAILVYKLPVAYADEQ